MESPKVLVDTDVVIDYLKKRQPGAGLLRKHYLESSIHVSSITVYELLFGVQKSGKAGLIRRLLKYVTVVPFDEAAAAEAASVHYGLKIKGVDIGVKDSFIAGTCIAHGLPLLTRNLRHFSRIPDIKLLPLR